MSVNNNDTFTTKDLDLSTFLELSKVPLVEIIPLTPYLSRFVFKRPPEAVLESWDGRKAMVNARDYCDARERLLVKARERQATLPRGNNR